MTPFTRSLEERAALLPITDPGWKSFFRQLDAEDIPATTFGIENGEILDLAYTCVTILSGGESVMPIRAYFVRELEIAQKMALNHIRSDLEGALLRNGIGDDKVWRCVGDVVKQCERDLLKDAGDLEVIGGMMKKLNGEYDVGKLRDAMRDRVRRERLEELILRGGKRGEHAPCRQA
jgi:hypothetical protein